MRQSHDVLDTLAHHDTTEDQDDGWTVGDERSRGEVVGVDGVGHHRDAPGVDAVVINQKLSEAGRDGQDLIDVGDVSALAHGTDPHPCPHRHGLDRRATASRQPCLSSQPPQLTSSVDTWMNHQWRTPSPRARNPEGLDRRALVDHVIGIHGMLGGQDARQPAAAHRLKCLKTHHLCQRVRRVPASEAEAASTLDDSDSRHLGDVVWRCEVCRGRHIAVDRAAPHGEMSENGGLDPWGAP